jgi:hydroxymethylpyrimidine/phosphomethylpyrimidine kinase
LPHAVKLAKRYITRAIAGSYRVGKCFVLGHFP